MLKGTFVVKYIFKTNNPKMIKHKQILKISSASCITWYKNYLKMYHKPNCKTEKQTFLKENTGGKIL